MAGYEPGDRVRLVKGQWAGKLATVTSATPGMAVVIFDVPERGDANAYVRTSSLRRA